MRYPIGSLALAGVILLSAGLAGGQSPPITLQMALDEPTSYAVQDATIAQVFLGLSDQTGIRFVIPPETLEVLPYGEQTRLSVTLKNVTPRNALARMLAPQSLRWEIRDQAVYILPTEALFRMCRRPSYDEFELLGAMHSLQLQPTAQGGEVIEQIRKAVGREKLALTVQAEIDQQAAATRAERVLPGTAAAWLDMYCRGQGCTWVLDGEEIVVLEAREQVKRQLQRQVSLRYQNASLMTVLRDLADKGRVALAIDPGVLNYLPPEARTNFGLVMADASIEQALQVIGGETGLKFTITGEGVTVEASERLLAGEAARTRPRAQFLVKMTLPGPNGADLEVFFRADELPPEVIEAINAEKEQLLRQIVQRYQSSPASRQPSRPAPGDWPPVAPVGGP